MQSRRRLRVYQTVGCILSLMSLLICMLGPMALYPFITGVSWDSPLPDWFDWVFIAGCGFGAGAAYLVSYVVVCKIGGYPPEIGLKSWNNRYK